MNRSRIALASALLASLLAASVATAQAPAPAGTFTNEQLEQLVAPVALYPDSLLMQVLMASTYPLEIVQAARWREQNAALKDAALEGALKNQEWDPSVKSLCTFPDVLKRMNDNLDWTQDLGDAFLGQQDGTLDAVQRMRIKAHEAGQLKSNEQQVVTTNSDKTIVIAPAQPTVVYVPTYSPTVVYGAWYYPHWYYPAMYVPPPPGHGFAAFTTGVIVGAALWGDCHWGWGHHDVHVDIDHYNSFNRNTNIHYERNETNIGNNNGKWKHDASHRRGVNYQNPQVAKQFNASGAANRPSADAARGRPATGAAGASARPAASPATRPNAAPAVQPAARPASRPASASIGGSSSGAFSGASNPGFDRDASSRGAASRGTARPSGGRARH